MKQPSQILSDTIPFKEDELMQDSIPTNPVWERLNDHEERLIKVEEKTKKIPVILDCVKRIERKFQTLIDLFKDGRLPAHDCIQQTKMDEFTVQLEKRDERLYTAFMEIKDNQTRFQEQIDNRKEKEREHDTNLRSDAEDIDSLENRMTAMETFKERIINIEKKYDRLFWLLLAFFILFMIKTFIWGY